MQKKYEADGIIEYIHIYPVKDDNIPEAMPFQHITDWYSSWGIRSNFYCYRGKWENQITSMSESLVWGYYISEIMSQIIKPILMIHSDKVASGAIAPKKMFTCIPSDNKKLVWFEGNQVQYQFYEDPQTIDLAVEAISKWF
ncbi:hypothetical protein ACOSHH_005419 [Klebsiella aerogenes]